MHLSQSNTTQLFGYMELVPIIKCTRMYFILAGVVMSTGRTGGKLGDMFCRRVASRKTFCRLEASWVLCIGTKYTSSEFGVEIMNLMCGIPKWIVGTNIGPAYREAKRRGQRPRLLCIGTNYTSSVSTALIRVFT